MRLQLYGDRAVLLVHAINFLDFYKHKAQDAGKADSAMVTMPRLIHCLESVDAAMMNTMVEYGVAMYHECVQPGSVLWAPACFFIVEKTVNGQKVSGVRWLCLPDYDTSANTTSLMSAWTRLIKLAKVSQPKSQARTMAVADASLEATLKSLEMEALAVEP